MAQPVDQFIKCLKLTRLAATDVFGRAAPRAIINRVAIRPQANDECGFANWRLHDSKAVPPTQLRVQSS